MERFNFSDFVHYDRNDPTQLQTIYFNCSPAFVRKFAKVMVAYKAKTDKIPDMPMVDYLVGMQQEIERELGQLTINQMLLVTHVIANRLGYESGYENGHKMACDQITRSYMTDVFGPDTENNRGSLLN